MQVNKRERFTQRSDLRSLHQLNPSNSINASAIQCRGSGLRGVSISAAGPRRALAICLVSVRAMARCHCGQALRGNT